MNSTDREVWVTTDDRGVRHRWVAEYNANGYALITRTDLTELMTRAGMRRSMDVEDET